jgi:hypothetical protein
MDIPSDRNAIRLFLVDYPQDLLQYVFLIVDHIKFIDALPDMQIGNMKQFHHIILKNFYSFSGLFFLYLSSLGFYAFSGIV